MSSLHTFDGFCLLWFPLLLVWSNPCWFSNVLLSCCLFQFQLNSTVGLRNAPKDNVNVNVNVGYMFIVPISTLGSADCTIYTPGIGTLSFTVSSPLGGIQHLRTFAAAIANHYNLAFSFHQVPITAGWTEAAWYERLAQHLYTWPAAWLEHQSPIQVLTGLGVT